MTSTTIDYGYTEEHIQSVGIEGAADANESLRRHHHGFVYCRRTDFICSSSAPLLYSLLSTMLLSQQSSFFVWNFVSSVTNSHDILSPEEGSDIQ